MKKVFSKYWFILAGLAVLLLDFCSKRWIVTNLAQNAGFTVFEDFHGVSFSIVHATNRGAAWGLFSSYPYALLVLRISIILFLLWLFLRGELSAKSRLPVVLILGGALGNVLDFFLYGHVVDYFLFNLWGYHFPAFDVADTAIFCGMALLVIQWFYAHFIAKKHTRK